MAGRKATPPRAVSRISIAGVADAATDRALRQLADAVDQLQSVPAGQSFVHDLAIGANVIPHGLGRNPRGVSVTPTMADASFAWALDRSAPHFDRQVVITVVGVAQPGALVEVR